MLAIETEGLTKRFGGRSVVRDLALLVPKGCVYGFLGPNGAGKTTTMRMLLGLIRPDAGSVRLLGHDLRRERLAAMNQVGSFVESPSLYDHLSGRANLEITRRLLALAASEVDRVLEITDLRTAASVRAGTYSLGMKQRLALARTLLGSPQLLMLDEPMNGLDPDGIISMRDLIRALPDRIDGTVFMSSHLLAEVEQTATVAGLIVAGDLVLQGEMRSMLGNGCTLRIDVDDPARALALLSSIGAEVIDTQDGILCVRCSTATDARKQAAALNRAMVEAGFAVSAVVPESRTLEQVYRSTIINHERIVVA